VAPDLGASKLAREYADLLDLPVAYIHKVRHSGKDVSVGEVTGTVRGRAPVLVDDMISTGGTIVSAIKALMAEGCRPQFTVVATHGLFKGDAQKKLASLPVERILVTDSVHFSLDGSVPITRLSLKKMLGDTIAHLHKDFFGESIRTS
jgi:ribose-phosphate pyrophosphokinase